MASIFFLGGAPGTAGNWSGGSLPVSGDDVLIDQRMTVSLTGANQASIVLASLTIEAQTRTVGSSATPWQIGAANVVINRRPPDGSVSTGPSELHLDLGTSAMSATVITSPQQGTAGRAPVLLANNNTASVLTVRGGNVGLATATPSQSSSIGTLAASGTCVVTLGTGATVAFADISGGLVVSRGTLTSAVVRSGTLEIDSATAPGTITLHAGSTLRLLSRLAGNELARLIVLGSSGTGTAADAVLDLSSDIRGVTIGQVDCQGPLTVRVATDPTQLTISTLSAIPATARLPAGIRYVA